MIHVVQNPGLHQPTPWGLPAIRRLRWRTDMRDIGWVPERRVVVATGGDAELQRALSSGFREQGLGVEVTTDLEGMIARAFDPDVLVTCVPFDALGWSGFDILSLIRSHEQSRSGSSAPVVAVGRRCCPQTRARALAAGFLSCLDVGPARSVLLDETLLRVRTLRPYLHRYTHSEDRESIVARFPDAPHERGGQQAILGLALAMDSGGIDLLQRSLMAVYQGNPQDARGSTARLAAIARGTGASRLAILSDAMAASLDGGMDSVERSVILSRVELDRVVHTLREEALRFFPS